MDQHGCPVTIYVRETQFFGERDLFGDGNNNPVCSISGDWELGDPFSEHIPEGLQLVPADPKTGKPSDEVIVPLRRQYVFNISPRTDAMAKVLSVMSTTDIHALTHQCFEALTDYLDFYEGVLYAREMGDL